MILSNFSFPFSILRLSPSVNREVFILPSILSCSEKLSVYIEYRFDGSPSISVNIPATRNSKFFSAAAVLSAAFAVTVTVVSSFGRVTSPFADIIFSFEVVHVITLPFLPFVIVPISNGSIKYPSAIGTDNMLSSVSISRSAFTASCSERAAAA